MGICGLALGCCGVLKGDVGAVLAAVEEWLYMPREKGLLGCWLLGQTASQGGLGSSAVAVALLLLLRLLLLSRLLVEARSKRGRSTVRGQMKRLPLLLLLELQLSLIHI